MARPVANLRLFAAIYPPPDLAGRLMEAVGRLSLPAHRPTRSDQVHLTVLFIGDMPASEKDWTIESVGRSTAGLASFSLTPQRLITLPERGPARLVAVETSEHPTLTEIQKRLAIRLATTDADKSSRRFSPHLTLARLQSPSAGLSIDRAIDESAFVVDRLLLMRSTLRSVGAEHHPVHEFPLGA